jgi:hypothetical protein
MMTEGKARNAAKLEFLFPTRILRGGSEKVDEINCHAIASTSLVYRRYERNWKRERARGLLDKAQ